MENRQLIFNRVVPRLRTRTRIGWFTAGLLLLATLSACQFNLNPTPLPTLPPQSPVPSNTPLPLPTATSSLPEPSATPQPSPSPQPTAAPTQFKALEAVVQVASMNMRSGPGTLHPIVAKYPEGSQVSIIGRAPGDEWVKVETEDYRVGWMLAIFLDIKGTITHLPAYKISDSHIIQGIVRDAEDQPVDGINFAIYLNGSPNGQPRTEGATNSEGVFYAYLPIDSPGEWVASFVGMRCTSRIAGADCKFTGQISPQSRTWSDVPPVEPLIFEYQK